MTRSFIDRRLDYLNETENNPNRQIERIKSYNGIDLIKFFCAYLICMIHIPPFQGMEFPYSGYIELALRHGICRIAVPFFLCASGFLLFNKIDLAHLDKERIKQYRFKLLRLLGLWSVLLFLGPTTQLWYLGGLFLCTILFCGLLSKGISVSKIIGVGALLYVFGLLIDSYSGFIEKLFGSSPVNSFIAFLNTDVTSTLRLGLFSTLVFFAMGVWFVYSKRIPKLPAAWFGFLVSVLLLLGEVFVVEHYSDPIDHNMYISLIPATFFLFSIARGIRLNDRPIYKKLRTIGVLVFFMHFLIKALLDLVFTAVYNTWNIGLSSLSFILTAVITTMIALAVEKLSHHEKCQWLRYLYF